MTSALCYQTATSLKNHVLSRTVSAREIVQAHLDQIEKINGQVNAICTLVPTEECLEQADAIDQAISKGQKPGALAGLPIAIKDLVQTRGIRTTLGSPIFQDLVPKKR